MPYTGTVTITSPHVSAYYGDEPRYLDLEKIKTQSVPPESSLISDLGNHTVTNRGEYHKRFNAQHKLAWENGIFAKMTGKSKQLHDEFDRAQQEFKDSKKEIPFSRILFGEEKLVFPISFNALNMAFSIARSGHLVDLDYDPENNEWHAKQTPVRLITSQVAKKKLKIK